MPINLFIIIITIFAMMITMEIN